VVKTRHSFIYKGQYFELDRYHGALEGLLMLETKGIEKQEAVNLPPCLTITEDVTGNPQYFAYNLALKR
jgi:CYTH domain-containing protein